MGLIRDAIKEIKDLRREREEDLVSSGVSRDYSVSLTQVGRDKAMTMSLRSPFAEVLSTLLEQGGTSTASEISKETHIPRGKVEAVISALEDAQYVKRNKLVAR